MYGSGGVGKSSLCASLKELGINPLFIDIGDGTKKLDVDRVSGIELWEDLRAALHDKAMFSGYNAVVIDDLSRAELMAGNWVIRNIKHEKNKPINGLEDYGWGKGQGHTYDEFIKIFGDLDSLVRDGLHVICIAHECIETVVNAAGDDWKQWQPRLQSPKSGKDSIRHTIKEWCDHMLFIGYDVAVTEDGKGKGAGTRTIYPVETPWCLAKSRTLADPVAYERGSVELWNLLLKGN